MATVDAITGLPMCLHAVASRKCSPRLDSLVSELLACARQRRQSLSLLEPAWNGDGRLRTRKGRRQFWGPKGSRKLSRPFQPSFLIPMQWLMGLSFLFPMFSRCSCPGRTWEEQGQAQDSTRPAWARSERGWALTAGTINTAVVPPTVAIYVVSLIARSRRSFPAPIPSFLGPAAGRPDWLADGCCFKVASRTSA